ncbi:uncharacterized protein CEXT_471641 [Caerostris extrusa]|uniref:Uncharacterized protein n=1 Tax=Caerostris extrusa TaxID=172846 RepID=A0AAV4NBP1_CAEEX|nr:uncharacterized protein CEXT_471641 [Caerostris extrusa]
MNRHVSKRVCLGLQFQTPTLIEDEDISLPVQSMISSLQSSSSPAPKSPSDTLEHAISDPMPESCGSTPKSTRVPCPYCNKLFKGERGVRKHIDFYGCPMAVGAKMAD